MALGPNGKGGSKRRLPSSSARHATDLAMLQARCIAMCRRPRHLVPLLHRPCLRRRPPPLPPPPPPLPLPRPPTPRSWQGSRPASNPMLHGLRGAGSAAAAGCAAGRGLSTREGAGGRVGGRGLAGKQAAPQQRRKRAVKRSSPKPAIPPQTPPRHLPSLASCATSMSTSSTPACAATAAARAAPRQRPPAASVSSQAPPRSAHSCGLGACSTRQRPSTRTTCRAGGWRGGTTGRDSC
jgi:hypothetical protein